MSHFTHLPASHSAHTVGAGPPPPRRVPASGSAVSLAFPQSATVRGLGGDRGHGAQMRSSRTWTTSSGEFGLLSDTDEVDDREAFVHEYNRLAKKHGVRLLIVEDFYPTQRDDGKRSPGKRGWLHRLLRSASSNAPPSPPRAPEPTLSQARPHPRHKRSVSDMAHSLVSRHEHPKSVDIQAMIRISGKSVLYLPSDYAPCALILPTCLRATAQHLAQNIATRGIFRISGSVKVVNALFDYYCYMEGGGANIASTVRATNLPVHIRSSVHDIASTFKRLLSVLPGGILGSLALFDALVAIHSQLSGDPEFPRTKRTKVRARLIALAVGTIKSQFRREVICAVFGLLSLIGRAAEVTPREDENRRPLPTADLMGYAALGIVFGPLLLGDLLTQYTIRIATPTSGLLLFPLTPQRLRRERRKSKAADPKPPADTTVNKVLVANDITEMLIANWRDIVRQMKALGIHHHRDASSVNARLGSSQRMDSSQPSVTISEDFVIKKPGDWSHGKSRRPTAQVERGGSPEPETPTLGLKRQRPVSRKSASSGRLMVRPSIGALSPTAEETTLETNAFGRVFEEPASARPTVPTYESAMSEERIRVDAADETKAERSTHDSQEREVTRTPKVSLHDIPPRTSSKPKHNQASSAARRSGRSSSRDDASPRRSTREYTSPQSTRGRRSTRPSKANIRDDMRQARSVRSSSRLPRSIRSSSAKARRPSRASPSGYSTTHRAAEKKTSTPRRSKRTHESETSGELSEELSSLLDEFGSSSKRGNGRTPSKRPSALSYATRDEAARHGRHEEDDYFFPAQNGSLRPRFDSEPAKPARRTSFDTTPKHFYSPMQVPPSLSGREGEVYTNTVPFSQTDWKEDISKMEGEYDSSVEEIQLRREKREAKASGRSSQRFQQVDETVTGEVTGPLPKAMASHGQQRSSGGQSIRPSVSEAASKRGAVKAMAAKFEGTPESPFGPWPSRPQLESREPSGLSPRSVGQAGSREIRGSRSGPMRMPASGPRQPGSAQGQQQPPDKPSPGLGSMDNSTRRRLRTSVSDNLALRAAAVADAEGRRRTGSPERRPTDVFRRPAPSKREPGQPSTDKPSKETPGMGNLGTMVPPQDQPPIAQHLHLPRPTSSSSVIPPDGGGQSETPTPGQSSKSSLHSQIRNLQRQLDTRADEAAQLRRQLEAREGTDVGTLSEQLREAKREVATWRERAEAAERRVKVFERFTARLRGIREAAAAADRQESVGRARPQGAFFEGSAYEEDVSPGQHVRRDKHVGEAGERSEDSGATEDAGVVTARIRKCLHGGTGRHDGEDDVSMGWDGAVSPYSTAGEQACAPSPLFSTAERRQRSVSRGAAEIWMAAQELLRLEDGEGEGDEEPEALSGM